MKITKELFINVGLAFVAGFVTSLAAFLAVTPKPTDTAIIISALAAALWAGVRGVIGFIALNVPKVPTVPVDE